jgi:hypothetical protein
MAMVSATGVGVRHALARALATANLAPADACFHLRQARVRLDSRHRVLGAEVMVSIHKPQPIGAWSPEDLVGCINPDGEHPLMARIPAERPFFLDILPVSWGRWINRSEVSLPPGVDLLHPRTAVDFDEALAFADDLGKRLPSAEELTLAWGDARYPWGERSDPEHGRHRAPRFDDLPEIGLHPPNEGGIFDLGAWLWQWTGGGQLFGGPERGPVDKADHTRPIGLRLAMDG